MWGYVRTSFAGLPWLPLCLGGLRSDAVFQLTREVTSSQGDGEAIGTCMSIHDDRHA